MRGGWRPGERASAAIVVVWILTAILWLTPGITRPDGAGYFAYLPSTWIDRDLLFFDEWARVLLIRDGQILFKDPTATGHLSNHWTAGASLAWYPAFAAADFFSGGKDHGFSITHVTAVAVTSAVAGLLTLLLGWQLAQRATGDGSRATAAAIAIWLGSPLAFYSLRHATMSHAVSAAACALVVWLCVRDRGAFAIGMAVGFACAVRPQNLAIALVPLFFVGLRRMPVLFGGALLAALPQLIVSQTLWGAPLAFVNIGGRAHPWQMFSTFRPFETLFSWFHGLVPWTPLLVVALAGLVLLRRSQPRLAHAGLALFLAQWLLLSLLERWFWGGASFGQRRFDSCTVFFIIGLAAFLTRVPRWIGATVTVACVGWTMLLFVASAKLNLNRYQSPSEVLEALRVALGEGQWRTPLGYTPPAMRMDVLMAALVTLLVLAAITFAARRAPVPLAAAYLVAMSAFYAWCGAHPKHDPMFRELARRQTRSGAILDTQTLLAYEAEYMERTGRPAEAEKARREAATLEK
jgi:hypothetical protein